MQSVAVHLVAVAFNSGLHFRHRRNEGYKVFFQQEEEREYSRIVHYMLGYTVYASKRLRLKNESLKRNTVCSSSGHF